MPSTILQELRSRVADAVKTLEGLPEGFCPQVTIAADNRFGDYQTNAAMVLAKGLKTNPRELATRLVAAMKLDDLAPDPQIAGPGFINFTLPPAGLASRVAALSGDISTAMPPPNPRNTLVVDFSAPNVAKPMHVGHIRSTILGDAISRIAEFAGHRVVRDNHIGDWGTQFGMLLVGWKTLLNPAALEADPIGEMERLYKAVNAQCTENPEVREQARAELVKLQSGDETNLEIWNRMIALSKDQFEAIYGRLDIRFDHALGESFYNPWLPGVVEDLLKMGIARESDGAVCVFSDETSEAKSDPFKIQRDGEWTDIPAIVRKGDGASNYTTTDLATLDFRLREWHPDEIVYVTDGRQQLHFRQLFNIFRRWRPEAADVRLEHVWFGSILGEDGKPFKTRSGETVKLNDLLDEAVERTEKLVAEKNPTLSGEELKEIATILGVGAVKFADLLPNRQSDYTFSWDKMLSLQGNSAPYLQYSCVRIRSIFRKAAEQGVTIPDEGALPNPLEPAELLLARKLVQFEDIVIQVLEDFRPNGLATWLLELASLFHSYFEACPVLKAETAEIRASRLVLCRSTANVLGKGLELLGIRVPDRM